MGMTISKKSIEVLKNSFLVRPGEERRKQMLRFQHGQFTEIEGAPEGAGALPAIYLRRIYKEDFSSLLRETEIELRKNQIFGASSMLAESALILNIAYRQTDTPISLENMLGMVQEVDTTTFIGIPAMAVIMSGQDESLLLGFRVGRFMVGGHALYQHYKLFEQSAKETQNSGKQDVPIAGSWIMRDPISCRVLAAAFDKSLVSEVRELHLGQLAGCLAEAFKSEFALDQSIPVALGAPAFDTNTLFSLNHLRIDVTFGTQGSSSQILLNHGSQTIPANIGELGLKNGVLAELQGDKPLGAFPDVDRMLGTFSRFLLKAKAHEIGSRSSDAFIHCVFALDLALGGKQDSTKNTTRRAAAIYSAATGVRFKDAEKELRAIFDARSKYVHEGTEISNEKFLLLLEICSFIAECLLRARASTGAEGPKFITEHWYPRLDLLVAAMIAGVQLSREHFLECGAKVASISPSTLIH
jgi:hypothetical protein